MNHYRNYQIAGCVCLLFFLSLSAVVKFQPALLIDLDQQVTTLIRRPYPALNGFFIHYTSFASPVVIAIFALLTAGLLLWKKYSIEALWLLFNAGFAAGILNPLLKLFFRRARPTLEHLVNEQSYSFPSGHAVGSLLFYGTIIILLPLFLKERRVYQPLRFLLVIGIVLIGISRIYLGVHFPSDILGGFSFGLSWLLLTYPFYQKRKRTYQLKFHS